MPSNLSLSSLILLRLMLLTEALKKDDLVSRIMDTLRGLIRQLDDMLIMLVLAVIRDYFSDLGMS